MRKPPLLSSVPLLPATAAFALGIAASYWFDSLWLICAAAVLSAILAIARRNIQASWAVMFGLGVVEAALLIPRSADSNLCKRDYFYKAYVGSVRETNGGQSLIVDIDSIGNDPTDFSSYRPVKVSLFLTSVSTEIAEGDEICFQARLTEPERITDLPDEITPTDNLRKKNIYLSGLITSDNLLSVAESEKFKARIVRFRSSVTRLLYQSHLSAGTKSFLNTVLLADTRDLPETTRDTFTRSGLSHILALSGLHVGLIALILSLAMWPLYRLGYRKWACMIIILLLWAYAVATGLSPSVTRAVIMSTIYMLGRLLQRRTSAANSLCLAALIILVADPSALMQIGFQLSFAAVAGIIMFARRINPVPQQHRIAYNCASLACVSISAMIGTGVIAAFYFHTFPIYFLLSNIIATFLLPPLIVGGFVVILLQSIGCDADVVCMATDFIYSMIRNSAEAIGSLPGAVIDTIYIPGAAVIAYMASVASLWLWLRNKTMAFGVAFAISTIAMTGIWAYGASVRRTPRLYISRTTYHTDIIIDDGTSKSLDILTTQPQETTAIKHRAEQRYRDYMGRRGIDSIRIINHANTHEPMFSKNGCLINFDGNTVAIAAGMELRPVKSDYALVCRGFKGTIKSIRETLNPDTVILSYDIHPRLRAKYLMECHELHLPAVDMRQQPWSLSPKSR